MKSKKSKNFIESFNYAVTGVINSLKTEKNMKFHFLIAFLVILLSLFFDFTRVELLLLFFAIVLVLIVEMINTAIETTIDLITNEYHPLARRVKDISAGAVLIATINALLVGYLLFFDRLNPYTNYILFKIKNSPIHLTFVALSLVVLLTIAIKTRYSKGKGTPFQGGVVSGHAAISFCVATIIAFIAHNMLVSTLSYFMAVLVAESRIEGKIHSLPEVIFGGVLGTLIGILVFQIIG